MARRTRAAAAEPPEERVSFPVIAMPAAAQESAKSGIEERDESELEEILDQIGNEGRITVYHIIDGKGTYAGSMTAAEFNLESLLDTFGGGDKSLTIFQGGRKVRTVRVSLDPTIPATSPRARAMARNAPQSSSTGPADQMAGVFARMVEMNAATTNMMQQAMAGIMAGVGTMMTAQQPRSDPLEIATRLAEVMTRNNTPAGGSASELFNAFDKGISLAARLSGDDSDGTLGIVGKGLDVVAEIVKRGGGLPVAAAPRSLPRPPAAAPAAAPPPPAASAAPAESPAPEPLPDTMNDRPWIAAIRPAAPLLLSMVGTFQPTTAAQALADRLKDEEFSDLLDDIESGPTVDDFLNRFLAPFGVGSAKVPPLQAITPAQADWLRQLVAAVKELVEDDEESGMAGDGAATTTD